MTNSKQYDIVLKNGRVIDPETYLDGTFNVGINGGQIAAVSDQPLSGKQERLRPSQISPSMARKSSTSRA